MASIIQPTNFDMSTINFQLLTGEIIKSFDNFVEGTNSIVTSYGNVTIVLCEGGVTEVGTYNPRLGPDLLDVVETIPFLHGTRWFWVDPCVPATYLVIEQDGEVLYVYNNSCYAQEDTPPDYPAVIRALKAWRKVPSFNKEGLWCTPATERLRSFYSRFKEVELR